MRMLTDKRLFLFRCLDENVHFPPGLPLWCQDTDIGEDKAFAIRCCIDSDFCNLDLNPTFAPNSESSMLFEGEMRIIL
jgi:Activin types I and II receptor domain.